MKAKGTFPPASCRRSAHQATAEGTSTRFCVLAVTAVPFPSSFIYQECFEKEKKVSLLPSPREFHLSLNICPKNIAL